MKVSEIQILSYFCTVLYDFLSVTICHVLQSKLYKMATLGTIQNWLSWIGGPLIKHLYKTTTNQLWLLLAGL